ncbi:MAG: hypothetical protein II202_01380, partial [Bacteroidales bacterium]|nr:hypothetical protein [Bacteroidales bacterium]
MNSLSLKTAIAAILLVALGTVAGWSQEQVKYDYLGETGLDATIYRGPEAPKYQFLFEGTQYAYTDEFEEGTVLYNGVEYRGVNLNLSASSDELHLKVLKSGIVIELEKRLVEGFTIGERQYLALRGNNVVEGLAPGFYEVLHSGKSLLLKKNVKKIAVRKHEEKGIFRQFESADKYYVVKDGAYGQVLRVGDIVKMFDENKKELKGFIKNNRDRYFGSENREKF